MLASTGQSCRFNQRRFNNKTNTATAGTYRSGSCPLNAHAYSQVDGRRHPGRHSQHPTTNPTDPKCPEPRSEPKPWEDAATAKRSSRQSRRRWHDSDTPRTRHQDYTAKESEDRPRVHGDARCEVDSRPTTAVKTHHSASRRCQQQRICEDSQER